MLTRNRGEQLFELPIGKADPKNKIVCTQPAPGVYLVTFTDGADNRLTSDFCRALILALNVLLHRHPAGVVITTSGIDKFYSNGLDLAHMTATPHFFRDAVYALWHRLATFPMPTVAWVNGHAFAGGLMLAMFHDYRAMNPHRGYLCLNELELGIPLAPPMAGVFRQKVSASVLRRMVLEVERFKALDALRENLVDWLGGLDETLTHIDELKLIKKARPGMSGVSVYGELKEEMWRETIDYLEQSSEEGIRQESRALRRRKVWETDEQRVRQWEAQGNPKTSKL